jgi:uncharacterized membrane protein
MSGYFFGATTDESSTATRSSDGASGVGRCKRAVGAALALVGGWLSYRALRGLRSGSADTLTASRSITIGRDADELTELLRDAENVDRIAGPFAAVTAADDDRQRWTVDAPLGRELT